MPTYRVEFTYKKTVVTYLDADSPESIHEFLNDDPEWDVVEDAAEIIDEETEEDTEYEVRSAPDVIANYGIHEGEIVEVEE